MKLVKHFDFIGPQFLFESNMKNRFETIGGGIISLLILVSSITIGYLFGREVYERKTPNSSFSKEMIDLSKVYLKEFPIMYTFTNKDGTPVSFSDTFDPIVEEIKMDAGGIPQVNMTSLYFKPCNYSDFTMHSENLYSIRSNDPYQYYCLSFNNDTAIMNELISRNSAFIRINLYPCGTFRARQCAPTLNVLNMMVILSLITPYVDPLNYNNPVQYSEFRYVQPIIYGTLKINYISVTNDIFSSDNGWLLQSIVETNYLSLSSIRNDANMIPQDQPFKPFYVATLDSPKLRIKTSRNYMKLQELFAKVGGIANAIFIAMSFLSSHYLRFKYLLFLGENIETSQTANHSRISNLLFKSNKDLVGNLAGVSHFKPSYPFSSTPIIAIGNDTSKVGKSSAMSLHKFANEITEVAQKDFNLEILPKRIKLDLDYLSYLKSSLCCNQELKSKFKLSFDKSCAILDVKMFTYFLITNYFNKQ